MDVRVRHEVIAFFHKAKLLPSKIWRRGFQPTHNPDIYGVGDVVHDERNETKDRGFPYPSFYMFYRNAFAEASRCLQGFSKLLLAKIIAQKLIGGCGERHTQEHAPNAQQGTADGDGGQNPDARQSDGGSHHTGINQVSL